MLEQNWIDKQFEAERKARSTLPDWLLAAIGGTAGHDLLSSLKNSSSRPMIAHSEAPFSPAKAQGM